MKYQNVQIVFSYGVIYLKSWTTFWIAPLCSGNSNDFGSSVIGYPEKNTINLSLKKFNLMPNNVKDTPFYKIKNLYQMLAAIAEMTRHSMSSTPA